MINKNVTSFRKDIYNLLENTIKYNEPINVSTKDGNAIVLSESDYNGLIETMYLSSKPGMEKKLIEGKNTTLDECISEDEVKW